MTEIKGCNCLTMYHNSSQVKTGNSGLRGLEKVKVHIFRAAEYDIV